MYTAVRTKRDEGENGKSQLRQMRKRAQQSNVFKCTRSNTVQSQESTILCVDLRRVYRHFIFQVVIMRLYDVHSDTSTRLHSEASPQTSVLSDMHKQPGNVSLLLLSMCKQSDFFPSISCHHSHSRLPKRFLRYGNVIHKACLSVRIKNIFSFQKNAFSLQMQPCNIK